MCNQILSGLAYLHGIAISHGALNPNNVIYHQNKWKLTKYGLAEIEVSNNRLFSAPEVIKDEIKCSASADMFSFGVLCFWIHDDRVPFTVRELICGANEGDGLEKRIHCNSHEQSDLLDLLEQLLKWNPNERITSLNAVEHPFFKMK